ncbi:MAG: hypothetical protein IJX70_06470 [Clostridia bacterium]|nr:hypothetical protein [Clostridia bacterium]MBQ9146080.1 hypothetical protein [Clostridia bacterium]
MDLATKKVLDNFCTAMNNCGWRKYERRDEDCAVVFGVNGDDIPMQFYATCYPKTQTFNLYSGLPMTINEDSLFVVSGLICVINHRLNLGRFDLNIFKRRIAFRVAAFYKDTDLTPAFFEEMLGFAANVVDKFNDIIADLNDGKIDLDTAIERAMS